MIKATHKQNKCINMCKVKLNIFWTRLKVTARNTQSMSLPLYEFQGIIQQHPCDFIMFSGA